jgi:hypothetical protein
MTSGQYVPMLNSQLLANVIMGRVREEISLDRLMNYKNIEKFLWCFDRRRRGQ